MSVSGVSSGSAAAAYIPPVQQQKAAPLPPKAQGADSVSLSPQAQKLATDGDTAAQETQESSIQRASEKASGIA